MRTPPPWRQLTCSYQLIRCAKFPHIPFGVDGELCRERSSWVTITMAPPNPSSGHQSFGDDRSRLLPGSSRMSSCGAGSWRSPDASATRNRSSGQGPADLVGASGTQSHGREHFVDAVRVELRIARSHRFHHRQLSRQSVLLVQVSRRNSDGDVEGAEEFGDRRPRFDPLVFVRVDSSGRRVWALRPLGPLPPHRSRLPGSPPATSTSLPRWVRSVGSVPVRRPSAVVRPSPRRSWRSRGPVWSRGLGCPAGRGGHSTSVAAHLWRR